MEHLKLSHLQYILIVIVKKQWQPLIAPRTTLQSKVVIATSKLEYKAPKNLSEVIFLHKIK